MPRLSTGMHGLDLALGGGLLPGTLTVVVGATGIGKTQLGVQFASSNGDGEPRGIIFDMTARGDSQHHAEYAQRIAAWDLDRAEPTEILDPDAVFDLQRIWPGYQQVFDVQGRRVTRQDLDGEAWRHWQIQLNARLRQAIAFFYAHFIRGVRRVVLDGIEPVDRPHDSIQWQLIEYLYHQVLRKDSDWVARDLLRERYRRYADEAARHGYPTSEIACLLLYTSREALLEELMVRPLDEGDALANANTVIYMGKLREGTRMRRALYVGKHRGSACSDEIIPYTIGEEGLVFEEGP